MDSKSGESLTEKYSRTARKCTRVNTQGRKKTTKRQSTSND